MNKLQVIAHRTPSVLATTLFQFTGKYNEGEECCDLIALSNHIKGYAKHYGMQGVRIVLHEHSLALYEGTKLPTLTINELNNVKLQP